MFGAVAGEIGSKKRHPWEPEKTRIDSSGRSGRVAGPPCLLPSLPCPIAVSILPLISEALESHRRADEEDSVDRGCFDPEWEKRK
jgi:hypothetical protein